MRRSVCVITGSRAEFGLLSPLIKRLSDSDLTDLKLVVTGSHLCKELGNTQTEIEQSGFKIDAKIPVSIGNEKSQMAHSIGEAVCSFTEYFSKNTPDMVVVLGDRYEIFAACTAAAVLAIPISHIHGGETTAGAVDEFFRHSITKMSLLHFTACEDYRRRVIQLGEEPDRVFNVGASGIENIKSLKPMSLSELSESLGFDLNDAPFSVVTYHPVTLENGTGEEHIRELITAMDSFEDMKYIITLANADAGGEKINELWKSQAKTHPNWLVVPSLGLKRYLSALRFAQMMLGNSSSGLIEAPSFGIPTVNIGDRQLGRMLADSVLCCSPDFESILEAMQKAQSPEFKSIAKNTENPFGDGNTSEKIFNEIVTFLASENFSVKKRFYDLNF